MTVHQTTRATGDMIGLLRGTGFPLGPAATRYPPSERNVVRLLRDAAREHPDKDWLVVDGTDRLTFAGAWARSARIAGAIRRSAGEGAHVALFLPNHIEFMPLFIGAIAGGGKAIPLNSQSRGPLLHDIVEHSDAQLLVAHSSLVERLIDLDGLDGLGSVELVVVVGEQCPYPTIHGAPVVTYDDWLAGAPADEPSCELDYREPCVIQYTSGTTGQQKGVVYPNHFLYLYGAMYVDSIGLHSDDVLSTPLPLYHAAGLHLIALAGLHAGATAHLKSRFSPSSYWDEIAADGATYSIILGPMAAIVMKSCEAAPEHRLRLLFCTPPPPQLEDFEKRFRTKIIWHAFAQTEISPHSMRPDIIAGAPTDTVGYPVDWMEFGVVDDHDRLVGPGEVGEIVYRPLHPYSMFLEYYKAPEITNAAMRNFMYHTGDLGHYDESGALHLRGRKQDRIRRRGENISAADLEYVALRHPDVLEAAAYGVPSPLGEDDVKLDVRLSQVLEPAVLREWLSRQLPRYMLPRYIELRDSFPKTPSERIQKYLLKELALDRSGVVDFEPA